jgi:hypothetical protein
MLAFDREEMFDHGGVLVFFRRGHLFSL